VYNFIFSFKNCLKVSRALSQNSCRRCQNCRNATTAPAAILWRMLTYTRPRNVKRIVDWERPQSSGSSHFGRQQRWSRRSRLWQRIRSICARWSAFGGTFTDHWA